MDVVDTKAAPAALQSPWPVPWRTTSGTWLNWRWMKCRIIEVVPLDLIIMCHLDTPTRLKPDLISKSRA